MTTCKPTKCLIDNGVISEEGCTPIGEAYIENNCFNSIERILSGAVQMNFLVHGVWNNPFDYDTASNANNKYCEDIKFLIESNASLITQAAGIWGFNDEMDPSNQNKTYLKSVRQLVCDINAAYDCNNLRRPFIQASVFEFVDNATFAGKELVEYVKIPQCVIELFMNEPNFDVNYYCVDSNKDGVADIPLVGRNDLFFDFDRIRHVTDPEGNTTMPGSFFYNCPDITNFETSMWIYHNATVYMDCGINAFHMGQMGKICQKERNNEYPRMQVLLDNIRNYAQNCNIGDVLLTAEPLFHSDGLGSKYYKIENGIKHHFFDYNIFPVWFNEVSSTQFIDNIGCDNPEDNYNIYNSDECKNIENKALIDLCVLEHLSAFDQSGIGPNGCTYDNLPLALFFDLGHGCVIPVPENPDPDFGHVWGFDDANWFSNLDEACKIKLFSIFFCNHSINYYNSQKINIPIPGKLPTSIPCSGSNFYRINQDSIFKNAVLNLVVPEENEPNFQMSCYTTDKCVQCGPPDIVSVNPKIFRKKYKKDKIVVLSVDKDCTSKYSWHIQFDSGSWENYQKGNIVTFKPENEGIYIVTLRIDNNRFPASEFGSRSYSFEINTNTLNCCDYSSKCDLSIPKFPLNLSCFDTISNLYSVTLNSDSQYNVRNINATSRSGYISNNLIDTINNKLHFLYQSRENDTIGANLDLIDIDLLYVGNDTSISERVIEYMDPCNISEDQSLLVPNNDIEIRLHPNPTIDNLFFITSSVPGELNITNIAGYQVFHENSEKPYENYPIFMLDAGFYFISFKSNDILITKKIIVL
jgi:hypothetical protein